MPRFLMILLVVSGLCLPETALSGKSANPIPDGLERSIDSLFARYDDMSGPGAALALVYRGNMVFSKGYGSANLEYDIPITPSTIFHIASVSKQFTVFAVLLLDEAGKLSLDDDIRKHIPEVPDFGHTITLRHLAEHTSGLRDQWNLLALAGWRLDDVITLDHVLKLVKNQRELNFAPGEEYLYSNTGFTLLAEVVARVSGQTFAEFTHDHIFEPLQMSSTLFYDDHQRIVPGRAYSYHSDSEGYRKSVLSYANAGATSLFTTVEDLSRWVFNFLDPVVGSRQIIDRMNTPGVLNNGREFGGALGQFTGPYRGLMQIQHGGADAGYRTYLGRFPDQEFAVIVFSNYAGFNARGMASRLTDLFLDGRFEEAAEDAVSDVEPIKLSSGELQKFAGHYWNDKDMVSVSFSVEDDTLRYSRGRSSHALLPVGSHEFRLAAGNGGSSLVFETGQENPRMILSTGGLNESSVFERYEPANYSTAELLEYLGAYISDELGTSYTLELNDSILVAVHQRHNDIVLEAVKFDVFTGNQWFFRNARFVRDDSGAIRGFRVSSGRVRDLWFEKRP